MITTLSEFESYIKSNAFQGHTGVRFAGVLYGVLMRLEGNGVSSQSLDNLLSDTGFKTRGHYSRYLQYGFKYCDDIYAFERLLGLDRKPDSRIPKEKVKPVAHTNRRKRKGLSLGEGRQAKASNEILLMPPQGRGGMAREDDERIEDIVPDFSDLPESPVEEEDYDIDVAEQLLPLGKKDERRPVQQAAVSVKKSVSDRGFILKRAKTEDDLRRERENRLKLDSLNDETITEDNYESNAIAESRRAGVPASARRGKVEGDE